jgi:uncharacterized protein involved in exopolysaccharide biosynthesis
MRIYGTSPLYNYVELIFRCKRMFILALIIGTLITSYMLRQRTDKYDATMVIALTGKPEVGTVAGTAAARTALSRDSNVLVKANQLAWWVKNKQAPVDFLEQVARNANLDRKYPLDFDEKIRQLRASLKFPEGLEMGMYLRVNLTWPDKNEAERVLSELFNYYRNQMVDLLTAGQTSYRVILERQYKRAEAEANAISQEKVLYTMNHFHTQPSLLATEVSRVDLAQISIQNAQADLEEMRARLAQISLQLQSTEQEVTVDKTTREVREDPALKLKADLEDAENRLTQLQQVYSPAHPSVQRQQQVVDAYKERIAKLTGKPAGGPNETSSEVHKTINPEYQKLVSLQNEYTQNIKAYTRRLEKLQQLKQQSEARLRQMPEAEVRFSEIMRNFSIKDNLRRTRQTMLADARIREETDKDWERNSMSLAVPPNADKVDTSSKRMLLYALGPLMGILIAFCFSLLAEALDHTLRTPVEVEKYLGKPVLAVIPRMRAVREGRKRLEGSSKPSITS